MNTLIILMMSRLVLSKELTFRREIRFTKVDSHIFNKSFGEVIEFDVHQYYGRHYLTMNFRMETLRPESMSVEVIKCKEYYVDCVNYHAFILNNFCNFVTTSVRYFKMDVHYRKLFVCPIRGQIHLQNVSFKAEEVMATLGNSLVEPWWEYHWIIRAIIKDEKQKPWFFFQFKYYFISISSFQDEHQKKKN